MMKLQYIILLVILANSSLFFSQDNFNISVHHDTKFFLTGDERGNHAGTLDLMLKIEIPIIRFKKSYIVAYPVFEHAKLHSGHLKRYAVGVGYIRQNLFFKKIKRWFTSQFWVNR